MSHPETEKLCCHCEKPHQPGTEYCPETGRPTQDITSRMIGRILVGKYRLIRCIGHGGMGTVFEAQHTVIGGRVAVKLLHEPFASRFEPVQRLYREARAAAAVGHRNVVQIFDIAETEQGTPFLVMELLKGESLRDHLARRGPMPIGECLDVGIQMLRALAAAHDVGVVHRDVKSDNVFLTRDEQQGGFFVKLLDFGISTFGMASSDTAFKTERAGAVQGTPGYMAPEQVEGRRDLDHRVDIYSAGAVLYEMLVGDAPQKASNHSELLLKTAHVNIEPPSSRRGDVPARLEALIIKALARDKEERPETCGKFAKALCVVREQMGTGRSEASPAESSPWVRESRD